MEHPNNGAETDSSREAPENGTPVPLLGFPKKSNAPTGAADSQRQVKGDERNDSERSFEALGRTDPQGLDAGRNPRFAPESRKQMKIAKANAP